MRIRAALDAARSALHGEGGPRVLSRRDQAPPVSFLVTLARAWGDLVVPLAAGRNFVGRGSEQAGTYRDWPEPSVVEQAQWWIECLPDRAEVWDASSTNLSVLLPGELAARTELRDDTKDFLRWFKLRGANPLPHPNVPSDRHRFPLAEGDVLRCHKASFAFGWLAR